MSILRLGAMLIALTFLAVGCSRGAALGQGAANRTPPPAIDYGGSSADEWRPGQDADSDPDPGESEPPTSLPPRVPGVSTATAEEDLSAGAAAWSDVVSAVTVEITSSSDGSEQSAIWIPATGPGPEPLVVALPSWSYGHDAAAGAPIAEWARTAGWAMIQPAARGPSGTPESTGSDLVVADVVDAIEWAVGHEGVDEEQVFLVGYSGGAMTALVVGGRHPERVAGVAVFSPIYDLRRWYRDMRGWNDVYADDVRRACGGHPLEDPSANDECRHRSPVGHLDGAREAGLPVYIGQGDSDAVTFPQHAQDAYDHVRDRSLSESDVDVEHHFGPDDPNVLSARQTGPVRFVEFEGEHDLVYHPALEWMAELAAADADHP